MSGGAVTGVPEARDDSSRLRPPRPTTEGRRVCLPGFIWVGGAGPAQGQGRAHLREDVQTVVGGRAVGAQAHVQSSLQELGGRGQSTFQAQIRAGTMGYRHAVLCQQGDVRRVHMHAMHGQKSRAQRVSAFQVLDRPDPRWGPALPFPHLGAPVGPGERPGASAEEVHLCLRFRHVRRHPQSSTACEPRHFAVKPGGDCVWSVGRQSPFHARTAFVTQRAEASLEVLHRLRQASIVQAEDFQIDPGPQTSRDSSPGRGPALEGSVTDVGHTATNAFPRPPKGGNPVILGHQLPPRQEQPQHPFPKATLPREASESRILQMGVAVDQAGQEDAPRKHAVVFAGMDVAKVARQAYFRDGATIEANGAVPDGRATDGKDPIGF